MENIKKGSALMMLKTAGIIIIIFLCLVFITLLCISGLFVKPEYLKPWTKDYAKSFHDPRIELAACGLLAANGHNMQPWKIKLDKADSNVFYLFADSRKFTGEVDPYARQMMVSQGTFLEYVKIGGEQFGFKTDIELFPEGEYEKSDLSGSMDHIPVAKITLTKNGKSGNELYSAMYLPDTNRSAYQELALSEAEINQLKEINSDPDLSFEIYQDAGDRKKLKGIAMKGIQIEAGVERVMKELEVIFRSNEYKKNKFRYGFSVEGQGSKGLLKHLVQGLVTIFPSMNQGKAASERMIQSGKISVDHTPAYILITSGNNSRVNQVKSGMLYSRLITSAHNLGLVVQPLSQPLEEYPEMKSVYGEIHQNYAKEGETIQMLVRIGRPTKTVPLSMRQDVMDIVSQ